MIILQSLCILNTTTKICAQQLLSGSRVLTYCSQTKNGQVSSISVNQNISFTNSLTIYDNYSAVFSDAFIFNDYQLNSSILSQGANFFSLSYYFGQTFKVVNSNITVNISQRINSTALLVKASVKLLINNSATSFQVTSDNSAGLVVNSNGNVNI